MQIAIKQRDLNNLLPEDRAAHQWYRFVLSYPPHLVRDYLHKFQIRAGARVLDPFCGTGTTLVECKKLGIASVGIEANPMTQFASRVKLDWRLDADVLLERSEAIAAAVRTELEAQGINDDAFDVLNERPVKPESLLALPPEAETLLLKGSISPLPLHKTLVLLRHLDAHSDTSEYAHQRLALARTLVASIGNLHFGPEVGVGKPKLDTPVLVPWVQEVRRMADDLRLLHPLDTTPAQVHLADARVMLDEMETTSIDAVITSPPYPNEKDYTRATRLESVLLGFVRDKHELKAMKQGLMRSNTRNVYVGDADDAWVSGFPAVQRLADAIEQRRIELGKTSGFERLYARTTQLYFGGMARHLESLRRVLRPGAHLAYVVGDQASYLRVMIRTGQLLGEIAQTLGYELVSIDLFRTRLATATREQLREEVVVLRWPG